MSQKLESGVVPNGVRVFVPHEVSNRKPPQVGEVVAHRRHRRAEAVRADPKAKALAAQEVFPSKTVRIKSSVDHFAAPFGSQQEAGALEEHRVRLDHGAGDVGQNRRVVRRRAQVSPVQGAPLVALDIDERVERVQARVKERIRPTRAI